jgi:hypothetical protein
MRHNLAIFLEVLGIGTIMLILWTLISLLFVM